MRLFALVAMLSLSTALLAKDPAPIKVEVSPRVQLSPIRATTQVWVRVTVPKAAQNRRVCVEVDGGIYRSSCYPHIGTDAPYRLEWAVKGLVAGTYVVVATLYQADGAEQHAQDHFCISDGDASECVGGNAEEMP